MLPRDVWFYVYAFLGARASIYALMPINKYHHELICKQKQIWAVLDVRYKPIQSLTVLVDRAGTKLDTLILDGCSAADNGFLEQLSLRVTGLRVLSLADLPWLSESAVALVVSRTKTLKILSTPWIRPREFHLGMLVRGLVCDGFSLGADICRGTLAVHSRFVRICSGCYAPYCFLCHFDVIRCDNCRAICCFSCNIEIGPRNMRLCTMCLVVYSSIRLNV